MTDLLTNFLGGEINIITGLVWLLIATVLSMIGGAIGGMILAGKDIGYSFSAMMGGLCGPAGVIPAMVFGLLLLKFIP
ncbi:MAG: hypothetical protein QNJ47_10670 [Nostocaceae cyanobacterium]|nr:hypothetical protein [Nostocaceae cyanobacterium]